MWTQAAFRKACPEIVQSVAGQPNLLIYTIKTLCSMHCHDALLNSAGQSWIVRTHSCVMWFVAWLTRDETRPSSSVAGLPRMAQGSCQTWGRGRPPSAFPWVGPHLEPPHTRYVSRGMCYHIYISRTAVE